MANVGYARVSNADEDLAPQLRALADMGCEQVFRDEASGARADRPGLMQALSCVRDGDVLVVCKLDRLGRSLSHLIQTVNELSARGVGFRSLIESIDTTTAEGRSIFAALAKFEDDLIRERTRAGLAAAGATSRPIGRKPVVSPDMLAKARALIAEGLTVREAAARLNVGKTALYAALRTKNGEPDAQGGSDATSGLASAALSGKR